MVYPFKKTSSTGDQLPTYSRAEPGARQAEDQVEITPFSVLPTHKLSGKNSTWNRSVSGVCRKHCLSPLHLQADPWQKVTTLSSSYNFLKRNTEVTSANLSSNQEYAGWVTWAPFTALQLCRLTYCALGSQFIKWGCELSASLTYYNNSSIKANNAWEQCKVILWNQRQEPYSSEFRLRESGLTKCSCQIWLESGR